ncbi:MAG: TerB family tellurite resistance protein [Pirellulaceae bacterium]|jgi:hypothetical protein|nr:TerB family tellurite resistance protein [Pirellulaceae bacterium]MDP7301697.1 TerB family tellurite resistance protein [Pirellulaceae bacterium]HJN09419.1 TerB family tellurite resistance protein [Pirellulaceae bacterium]
MIRDETVDYLANIYAVVAADGAVERIEERVFESIAREIGAGYFERKQAIEKINTGQWPVRLDLRWSDRIRNLEDMLFVGYCDGTLDPTEKQAIINYANLLSINQQQLGLIKEEAKRRFSEFE